MAPRFLDPLRFRSTSSVILLDRSTAYTSGFRAASAPRGDGLGRGRSDQAPTGVADERREQRVARDRVPVAQVDEHALRGRARDSAGELLASRPEREGEVPPCDRVAGREPELRGALLDRAELEPGEHVRRSADSPGERVGLGGRRVGRHDQEVGVLRAQLRDGRVRRGERRRRTDLPENPSTRGIEREDLRRPVLERDRSTGRVVHGDREGGGQRAGRLVLEPATGHDHGHEEGDDSWPEHVAERTGRTPANPRGEGRLPPSGRRSRVRGAELSGDAPRGVSRPRTSLPVSCSLPATSSAPSFWTLRRDPDAKR